MISTFFCIIVSIKFQSFHLFLFHSFHFYQCSQKALIGGNWKCNGTVDSVKKMISVLNAAGPFSANSEVQLIVVNIINDLSINHTKYAVIWYRLSSQPLLSTWLLQSLCSVLILLSVPRMSASRRDTVPSPVSTAERCSRTAESSGPLLVTASAA